MLRKPIINKNELDEQIFFIADGIKKASSQYRYRCYLLLDPFVRAIDDEVFQPLLFSHQSTQIKMNHSSFLAQNRPYLIELNLENKRDYDLLLYSIVLGKKELNPKDIASGLGRQIGGWIISDEPATILAKDIALASIQHYNGRHFLLRFYDPAIFSQLLSLFPKSQHPELLGRIVSWLHLDRLGSLIHYENDKQNRSYVNEYLITQSPDKQLLDSIYVIGINNQLLMHYAFENGAMSLNEVESLHRILPSVLRLMSKLKNESIKDRVLMSWAKLAYLYGADFDLKNDIISSTCHFQKYYEYSRWLNVINKEDFLKKKG